MKLVYGKEGPLFAIVLVLSLLIWAILIVGTFGLALIYVLFFFIIYLFAHSAYISYIRGTGTQVTREQFPDLYGQLENAGKKLEMRELPDTYIVNSNGVLNAMATRFLGHNLLVLNSDIVDALEERPAAISFYIGHELGHIKRKHLLMAPVVFFGMIFPLLGFAYSRAREYTCDLHGLACCENLDDAQRALAVLSVGHRRWKQLNLPVYAGQIQATAGFWMSFHELIGDYPWLVKRIEHITAVSQSRDYKRPSRNFFAWIIALFVPRFPVAGGSSGVGGLMFIAMIGVLAAVAIPAYQDYIARSQASEAIEIAGALEKPLADFYRSNQGWPNGLAPSYPKSNVGKFTDHVELVAAAGQTIGVLATLKTAGINFQLVGKTVELWTTDGGNTWYCGPGDNNPVDPKYLPASCHDSGAP